LSDKPDSVFTIERQGQIGSAFFLFYRLPIAICYFSQSSDLSEYRKKLTPDLTLVVMPSGVASRADYGFEGVCKKRESIQNASGWP
jgi:hypothetical protein